MPSLTPFIVSGTITLSDASNPSGVKVVARNDKTIENTSINTDANGQYVLDLSNLTSGWTVGDSITVLLNSGLETGSSSFTITSTSVDQTVDITTSEIVDSSDVSYCTISDVYQELDDKTTSDIGAEPIRDYILRAEAQIDRRTGTSFKSNTQTDEVYDINWETLYESPNVKVNLGLARQDGGLMGGTRVKLKNKPILSVSSLSTNGAGATGVDDWTERTQHTGTVAGDFSVYKKSGLIEWLQNGPNVQRRAFKLTYNWGLDRDSTDPKDLRTMELVRKLCILITVKEVLGSKGSSSQFSSIDSISLESISITKGIGDSVTYLNSLNEAIEGLYKDLGTAIGWNIGLGGGDY